MSNRELLAWADEKLDDWQCDALRRIAEKGELSDTDRAQVLANLKRACGIASEGEFTCRSIQPCHLKPAAEDRKKVVLCSLADVENVNRLAGGQKVSFAVDGITLVYGDNGSGKSGYSRIIKKLCGARGVENLLSNVFAADAEQSYAKATVRFHVDGEDVREFIWEDGAEVPDELSKFLVFDTHHSRLYVDEKNKIEYLPYEIALLEDLAQLFTELGGVISNEAKSLDARISVPLPGGYTEGTKAHALLRRLSSQTKIAALPTADEIEEASVWGAEQEKHLLGLERGLANDPRLLAERYGRLAEALRTVSSEAEAIELALNDVALTQVCEKLFHAKSAKKAAQLAADEVFSSEPLPHIGSDPWHLMYTYAKNYARLVYPDNDVLPTEPSDRCVLCQQELSEEARARFDRFERYVTDRASQEAQRTENTLREITEGLKDVQILATDELLRILGEYASITEPESSLREKLISFFAAAGERRKAMLDGVKTGALEAIPALPASPSPDCDAEVARLESAQAALEAQLTGEQERASRRTLLNSLSDAKRLAEQRETVLARRDDLELLNKLTSCQSALNTQRISIQINALRERLLTAEFKKRVDREIANLNLHHVPIRVEEESRRGESRYGLTLNASRRVQNRHVLSEGEQRAIALACFFAELSGVPGNAGILFDDPVSSLDRRRMRKVAERIVQEAQQGR
jgi:energy-coupling factor transporter ATP-binding protein EcfA2